MVGKAGTRGRSERGSGADEGVRPTTKYVTNHWDRRLDPTDRFPDQGLFWLSALHFGRFDSFTKAVWAVVSLVPSVLAFTGTFICCRRVIYKKPSNPNL